MGLVAAGFTTKVTCLCSDISSGPLVLLTMKTQDYLYLFRKLFCLVTVSHMCMNNLPEVIMSSDTMYDVKLNGKNLAGTPVVLTTVLVTSKNYTPVFCEHFR